MDKLSPAYGGDKYTYVKSLPTAASLPLQGREKQP